MKNLIGKKEMAALLGISVATLDRRRKAREIPFIKQSNRCIRFDADKVMETVRRHGEVRAL